MPKKKSHPNNKQKAEQTENSTNLLRSIRQKRSQGKMFLKLERLRSKYREPYSLGQKCPWEPVVEYETLKCN